MLLSDVSQKSACLVCVETGLDPQTGPGEECLPSRYSGIQAGGSEALGNLWVHEFKASLFPKKKKRRTEKDRKKKGEEW